MMSKNHWQDMGLYWAWRSTEPPAPQFRLPPTTKVLVYSLNKFDTREAQDVLDVAEGKVLVNGKEAQPNVGFIDDKRVVYFEAEKS